MSNPYVVMLQSNISKPSISRAVERQPLRLREARKPQSPLRGPYAILDYIIYSFI